MPVGIVQQSNFNGGELGSSLWGRTDLAKYSTGVRQMKNFIPALQGDVRNRPGTRYVCNTKNNGRARLIRFQFSTVQSYVLEFGDHYIRFVTNGGQIVDGSDDPIEVVTPYAVEDVDRIQYAQSADVLFLVHPDYPPQKLERYSNTNWVLSPISFGTTISTPSGFSSDASGSAQSYKVTALLDGEESLAATTGSSTETSTLSWSSVSGVSEYNVYKRKNGVYGWIGRAGTTSFKDSSIIPDSSKTPPINNNPFSGINNYPGSVTIHQQRLIFARTNNKPQTIWGSQTGSFYNFNISSPLQDDDSYEFTIYSNQVNEIQWVVALRSLLIGTTGGEYEMTAGDSNAITPTSVEITPQGHQGSEPFMPIIAGSNLLFVARGGTEVRDYGYSFEIDGYAGNNMSVLAGHLFEASRIREWAFHRTPYSTVWMVSNNGKLYGLIYDKEQEVVGWHQHETDGSFESVVTVVGGDA